MTTTDKIGFFEDDITPMRPAFLAGFASRTAPMEGVQDPIYLRIMTLTDKSGQSAVLITADLLSFPEDFSWRIKGWIEQELNIPSANIILNASHTHYGPLMAPCNYAPNRSFDIDYLNALEATIQQGVKTALNEAEAGEVYYGFTDIKLGVNRRSKDETGKVSRTMRPNLDGFYDSQVPVMAIYRAEKLAGIFYSVNCHPTSQNINKVSADYPGAISRALKNIFGTTVQTIFAQGTGGSAKTNFYDKTSLMFKSATLKELDRLGCEAAAKIAELVNSNELQRLELKLSGREKEFMLPYDRKLFLSQTELLTLATNEASTVKLVEKYWATQLYETNRTATTSTGYRMHLTKLSLNDDLAILGMAGEVTGEMGAIVKKLFPAESIICLGYCTKTSGYIPTDAMLPEGGYEADAVSKYMGWPAPFAPGIDKIMQQEVVF